MRLLAMGIVWATLVTGCASTDESEPTEMSSACIESVVALDEASATATATYEKLLTTSLDDCATTDEWLGAARQYPGAAGLAAAEYVNESFLEIACHSAANEETKVCRDGLETGTLDGNY